MGYQKRLLGLCLAYYEKFRGGAKGKKGRIVGKTHQKMKVGNKKGQLHLNRLLVGTLFWSNPAPDHQGQYFLVTKSFPLILFCVTNSPSVLRVILLKGLRASSCLTRPARSRNQQLEGPRCVHVFLVNLTLYALCVYV